MYVCSSVLLFQLRNIPVIGYADLRAVLGYLVTAALVHRDEIPHFAANVVAANMYQRNALTSEELREIESKQEKSDEATNRMLELLETKSNWDLESFLYGLLSTGHRETYDFFFTDCCKSHSSEMFACL